MEIPDELLSSADRESLQKFSDSVERFRYGLGVMETLLSGDQLGQLISALQRIADKLEDR